MGREDLDDDGGGGGGERTVAARHDSQRVGFGWARITAAVETTTPAVPVR